MKNCNFDSAAFAFESAITLGLLIRASVVDNVVVCVVDCNLVFIFVFVIELKSNGVARTKTVELILAKIRAGGNVLRFASRNYAWCGTTLSSSYHWYLLFENTLSSRSIYGIWAGIYTKVVYRYIQRSKLKRNASITSELERSNPFHMFWREPVGQWSLQSVLPAAILAKELVTRNPKKRFADQPVPVAKAPSFEQVRPW